MIWILVRDVSAGRARLAAAGVTPGSRAARRTLRENAAASPVMNIGRLKRRSSAFR
jgi:hypothetical protein